MRRWIVTAVAGLSWAPAVSCGGDEEKSAADPEREETRAIMGEMFGSLREVLPETVRDRGLAAPEVQPGLSSPEDWALSSGVVDEATLAALPAEDRATLQMARGRFDDALETLEALLASPSEHPAMMIGPLTDYLAVSIRVKGDLDRPIPTLERFAKRADLWERLREDVVLWTETLRSFDASVLDREDLDTARELIDASEHTGSHPTLRSGLVHLVVASAVLQRYAEHHPDGGIGLGEAYYLLGLIEARIGRNYWMTQAESFLEAAIRLAPGEPFARGAYALLEEETLKNYEGEPAASQALPDEDVRRLAELRQLIDARSGNRPPTSP
jgi:hypothetical protein